MALSELTYHLQRMRISGTDSEEAIRPEQRTPTPLARILEVTSYPPPRAGWGVRVEHLKKRLEAEGHRCVVLNIGMSRHIPSDQYETVLGARDFLTKAWRFSRLGFIVHAHANGDSLKGLLLALAAEAISLLAGRRCVLTFHAGAIQRFFPIEQSMWFAPLFWLLFTIPQRIICNSEPVKMCITKYGIRASKIVAIPAFSRQYLEFSPVPLPSDVSAFAQRYPSIIFTYLRMRSLFYPTVLIDGMAEVMRSHADVGLVVVGGSGHGDEGVLPAFHAAIEKYQLKERVCLVDDLDHDAFLTMLQRSCLYLRTPITDGVAASVLESLAVGTPVVASENGTRPAGVLTYVADSSTALAAAVTHVLHHRAEIVANLPQLSVGDTVADEIALLVNL